MPYKNGKCHIFVSFVMLFHRHTTLKKYGNYHIVGKILLYFEEETHVDTLLISDANKYLQNDGFHAKLWASEFRLDLKKSLSWCVVWKMLIKFLWLTHILEQVFDSRSALLFVAWKKNCALTNTNRLSFFYLLFLY